MDKDKMEGKGKQVAGKAREMYGRVTGDEEQELKGDLDQAEGKGQETFGDAKEKVKDIGRKLKGD